MKKKDFVSKIEEASYEAGISCYVTSLSYPGYAVICAHSSYVYVPLRRVVDVVYNEKHILIRCIKGHFVEIFGSFMSIQL